MRSIGEARREELEHELARYHEEVRALPGAIEYVNLLALTEQFVDSIRRVEFAKSIGARRLSPKRAEPSSELFDPLKAAAWHRQNGNIEEACWLVFLATHFGKNVRTGWRLAQDIYGSLGGDTWFWSEVSKDSNGLGEWIEENYEKLSSDGVARLFGNHRKYESIRPSSSRSTGAVVESYVEWVMGYGSHHLLFEAALDFAQGNARRAFSWLYEKMSVKSFGRMAKFDYLTMLSKLDLAAIEADSPYLEGATGPLKGARLLFSGSRSSKLSVDELNKELIRLGQALGVGMQEVEDALCNWQKSPNKYVLFRG